MNQKTSIENLSEYVNEKAANFVRDNAGNFDTIDIGSESDIVYAKKLIELNVRSLILDVINDSAIQSQETINGIFRNIEKLLADVTKNSVSKLSRNLFESGSAFPASDFDKMEHVEDDLPPSVGGGVLMAD